MSVTQKHITHFINTLQFNHQLTNDKTTVPLRTPVFVLNQVMVALVDLKM